MDGNMIEKLKAMLDDPETVKALSDTISSIMPQGASAPANIQSITEDVAESRPQEVIPSPQFDVLSSLKETLSASGGMQDPRINLLYSLKPYLRPSRSAKMDQAIKLIQITKIASLLK